MRDDYIRIIIIVLCTSDDWITGTVINLITPLVITGKNVIIGALGCTQTWKVLVDV